MQFHPTPLAIALAIVLSAPSSGIVHAAPHGLKERFVTLEPRQGAREVNGHLPMPVMEGNWPTPTTTANNIATVTRVVETVTILHGSTTAAPAEATKLHGGTMEPATLAISSTASSSPTSLVPSSSSNLSTQSGSTTSPVNTVKDLPSSSFVITVPGWSTLVIPIMPTESSAVEEAEPSSTAAPSPTATPSQSENTMAPLKSSSTDTCPGNAVRKCCTSLENVSNSLLNIIRDIFPVLDWDKFGSDFINSSAVGLSCTDIPNNGVCENVPSCCTEKTVAGLNTGYMSCYPLS